MRELPGLLEYARTEESLLCPRKHECQSDPYVGRTGVVSRTATVRAGTHAIETHIGGNTRHVWNGSGAENDATETTTASVTESGRCLY